MARKRTNDEGFFDCPICGKKPYVNIYPVNSGSVYCKGSLFKHHTEIYAKVDYAQPSKLYKTLSVKWADAINDYDCAKLPVW